MASPSPAQHSQIAEDRRFPSGVAGVPVGGESRGEVLPRLVVLPPAPVDDSEVVLAEGLAGPVAQALSGAHRRRVDGKGVRVMSAVVQVSPEGIRDVDDMT